MEISPSDRIRELTSIAADVAAMLEAGGKAIDTLSNRPLDYQPDDTPYDETKALKARQEAFQQHAKAYYTDVQAVVAKLRRQVYALEEAGIIAAEAPSTASLVTARPSASSAPGAASLPEPEKITNSGLGSLDIGWLNSRGNKVGAEKEAELMEEAKKLLGDMAPRPA